MTENQMVRDQREQAASQYAARRLHQDTEPPRVTDKHLILNPFHNNPRSKNERGLYGNSLWYRELAITEGDTLASLGMTRKGGRSE